jgi:hypothetical protein
MEKKFKKIKKSLVNYRGQTVAEALRGLGFLGG